MSAYGLLFEFLVQSDQLRQCVLLLILICVTYSQLVRTEPTLLIFSLPLNDQDTFHLQIFHGNEDKDSLVKHNFTCPFNATYVRIKPLTWTNGISMSFGVSGFDDDGKYVTIA